MEAMDIEIVGTQIDPKTTSNKKVGFFIFICLIHHLTPPPYTP
jgi:hypothetical protein